MSEIGDSLRELRIIEGLSISKLAELSGVSRPYLSQIESGTRTPSPDILKKISGPLNIKHSLLMEIAGYIDSESQKRAMEQFDVYKTISSNADELFDEIEKNLKLLDSLHSDNNNTDKETIEKELEDNMKSLNFNIRSLSLLKDKFEEILDEHSKHNKFNQIVKRYIYTKEHKNQVIDIGATLSNDDNAVTLNGHHLTNEQKQEILNYAKYLLFSYKED